MKDIIILICLFLIVFGFDAMANEPLQSDVIITEREGTLIIGSTESHSFSMEINTDEGQIKLSNVHTPYKNGCTYGRYKISENIYTNQYLLLEMIECVDDQVQISKIDDQVICPEIWMPVCGQSKQDKVMTFGNICELKASKATFITMGQCE